MENNNCVEYEKTSYQKPIILNTLPLNCQWCGRKPARAFVGTFRFCKKCYPIMKVSKIDIGRYLIEQAKQEIKDASN